MQTKRIPSAPVTRATRTAWVFMGAAAAVLVLLVHPGLPATIFKAALIFMLCCIAAHDAATRRIENATVLAIICLRAYEAVHAGVFGIAHPLLELAASCAGALTVLTVLLVTAHLSERLTASAGIGGGDVKLLAALGFFLGWERGLIIAGLSCVLLVAMQTLPRGRPRSSMHAFAPYIAVSSLLALLVM